MNLWQLKNPQTGENIGEPQVLPENWGPIFGMEGVKDRLGDLSWLGITDRCWIQVLDPNPTDVMKSHIDALIELRFNEASEAIKNSKITKLQWRQWVEYQQKLQEIPLQIGYPKEIFWPAKPE